MGQLSYGDWQCAERERQDDREADAALADEMAAENEADDDLDEASEVMA